jgi:4-hydroxybenzoate polyprenyltransferase
LKYLRLIRIKHWVKNSFLFIPVFFSGDIFNLPVLLDLFWGWLAFGLVASCVYIINDYRDIEKDRQHPTKRHRPLALGAIAPWQAWLIVPVFLVAGFGLAGWLSIKFLFLLALYLVMNLFYSFGMKNISVLDIFILSAGFVIRVKSGGAISDIYVSEWLTIMIFLLALFMAIGKRRDDVLLKAELGTDMRKASKGYNLEFINVSLALIASIIIVAYITYTVSPEVRTRFGTHRVYYTCLFVIAGLLRYLQIIFVESNSGSPTDVLIRDRFIQLSLLGWAASFFFIIYYREIKDFVLG